MHVILRKVRTKQASTLCGQSEEVLLLQQVMYIATTVFKVLMFDNNNYIAQNFIQLHLVKPSLR